MALFTSVVTTADDSLQRVERHPASQVALLTPRLWKDHFAAEPLRSAIDRVPADVVA